MKPGYLLYRLIRKKGFIQTIEYIYDSQDHEMVQAKLFKKIKENGGNLNNFFRVKKVMLDYKLVDYKLNEKTEKVIYLTEKGIDLYKKIIEIENFLLDKDAQTLSAPNLNANADKTPMEEN